MTAVLCLIPLLVLLLAFFVLPFGVLLYQSFFLSLLQAPAGSSPTLANYAKAFGDFFYLRVLLQTLALGAAVTGLTLVLGYPVAYVLARTRTRWRQLLIFLVISPLVVSIVIRSYGWMVLLGRVGTVNAALQALGLVEKPLPLMYNWFGVVVALTHVLLPFMILTLTSVIEGIPESLEDTAAVLGAGWWQRFRQQQRVALARCLVVGPSVLLLDEPLGALDKKLREAMQVELKSLQRQVGITTIFVTHDQEEALTMSDRIAVMHQGRLQQFATPQEIYEAPRNRFVAEFIGVCNFLEGRVSGRGGAALLLRTDAGDLVRVAWGAGGPLDEGARVVATLRPEKLVVRAGKPVVAGALRARLEALVYVGTAVHFHLRTSSGERLIAYRQNDSAPPPELTPGAEVQVTWEPNAVRLLPE